MAAAHAVAAGCQAEVRAGELELRVPEQLVSVNGAPATASVRAVLVRPGETDIEVAAAWTLSSGRGATLEADGRLEAPPRAQDLEIEARFESDEGELIATATMPVMVRRDVLDGPGLNGIVGRFAEADEVDGSRAFLTSTFSGTRVPANVRPLALRWEGGQVGDRYRLRVTTPRVQVDHYLWQADEGTATEVSLDEESWSRLIEDARGATIETRVDRLTDAGLVIGTFATIEVATGALEGELFAWAVQEEPAQSSLVRIPFGAREVAPLPELGAAECTGCHAATSDGRSLLVTRDLTETLRVDLETGRVDPQFATPRPLDAAAFLGDGSVVASVRAFSGSLPPAPSQLVWLEPDGAVRAAAGLPTEPSASPATGGGSLFYIEGGSDHPAGTDAPTRLIQVAVGDGFAELGAPEVLLDGAALTGSPEGGSTLSRPAVTPDGDLLVVAHGTNSRLVPEAGIALYALRPGGLAVRLDRGMPPDAETRAAWPTLALDSEGLPWVFYYAEEPERPRRLFGSALALDALDAGTDPSSPPFEVPSPGTAGQMAPAWVTRSRLATGDRCRADAACASDRCIGSDDIGSDDIGSDDIGSDDVWQCE
ncbi:MAG: hypothetical protein AAGF12_03715 [Myxococcota bacterium]